MAPTTAPESAKPALGAVIARRALIAVILVLLILVPSIALMAATGQPAASYAALGTIVGAVAVVAGGIRIGVLTAIVTALLAPLAVVSGLSPVTGAALMAIMTMTVGRLSTFGLHRATMLVPVLLAWPIMSPVPWLPRAQIDQVNDLLSRQGMSLASALGSLQSGQSGQSGSGSATGDAIAHLLTQQRMDSTYLAWVAAFFFIGAIIPVLLGPVVRRRMPAPALTPHPRSETVPYTATITVLSAVGTFYFLNNPKVPGGAFLIATILVLTQVGNDIQWRLTIQRVLGTLGGVALFVVLTNLIGGNSYVQFLGLPFPVKIYVVGTVFAVFAIMAKFSSVQWLYYALITPTTAFLNAFTISQASDLGEARLVDNVVGAALVILAALITVVAGRVYAREAPGATTVSPTGSPA